jgi:hypothetical protein
MNTHTEKCYPDEYKSNGHYKEETMGKMNTAKEAPADEDYRN